MSALSVVKELDLVGGYRPNLGVKHLLEVILVRFELECSKEALHWSMIVAVAIPQYAASHLIRSQMILVGVAVVLASSVIVMNQSSFGSSPLEPHLQGRERLVRFERFSRRPPNDTARV